MSYPNILIVSGSELGDGVGEQFVDSMINEYPHEKIIRYVLSSSLENKEIIHKNIKTFVRSTKASSIPIYSNVLYGEFRRRCLPIYVEDIQVIVNRFQIEIVWFILNSEQIINIAAGLIHIKCKKVAHVWDTPDYIVNASRLFKSTKKKILSNFDLVMSNVDHVVGISENMVNTYKNQFNKDSSLIYFASDINFLGVKDFGKFRKKDEATVVFAGSLYAWREWNSFVKAVEIYNSSAKNLKKIKIIFLGMPSRWAKIPKWIEKLALLPSNEAIQIVSKSDLAYLPYWMDKKYADTVNMAFPSKLAFYSTAAIPILFHGPTDSNPSKFITEKQIGISCDSYEAEKIINSINAILDGDFLNNFYNTVEKVYQDHFDKTIPARAFNNVILCLSKS